MAHYSGDYVTSSSQLKQPILAPSLQRRSNLELGGVYFFTPRQGLTRLVLLQKPAIKSVVVAIVPRRALLIVLNTDGNWRLIQCCGFEGWINVASQAGKPLAAFQRMEQIVRYQDWKGNNHLMCEGRVMLGADRGYFLVTNLLILIPSVLFFVYVNFKLSVGDAFAVSLSLVSPSGSLTHSIIVFRPYCHFCCC